MAGCSYATCCSVCKATGHGHCKGHVYSSLPCFHVFLHVLWGPADACVSSFQQLGDGITVFFSPKGFVGSHKIVFTFSLFLNHLSAVIAIVSVYWCMMSSAVGKGEVM